MRGFIYPLIFLEEANRLQDRIEVLFASDEKDFIYNFGVNKGYSTSYSKINRCYFLSSEAKQLYHNISDYAYGGKRDCFPSQTILKAELGWGNIKFDNALEELKEAGFITTTSRAGKPLLYRINELHKIQMLVHSELIHAVRKEYQDMDEFFPLLAKYKESDICSEVSKAMNPFDFKENIYGWFEEELEGHEHPVRAEEPVVEKKPPGSVPVPTVIRVDGDVKRGSLDDNKRTPKKGVPLAEIPIEDWGTNEFVKYFKEQYLKKFETNYVPIKGEAGSMKRIVKGKVDGLEEHLVAKVKGDLKSHIENFITLDFFETKTMRIFSSNYSQTILDGYLNSGKLPSYRVSEGAKKNNAPTNDQALKDWASDLDGIYK